MVFIFPCFMNPTVQVVPKKTPLKEKQITLLRGIFFWDTWYVTTFSNNLYLDIRIRDPTHIHCWKLYGLNNCHRKRLAVEIVLQFVLKFSNVLGVGFQLLNRRSKRIKLTIIQNVTSGSSSPSSTATSSISSVNIFSSSAILLFLSALLFCLFLAKNR